MTKQLAAATTLGIALVAGAIAPALAQEKPTAPLRLSGTYQVKNVSESDDGTVTFDFSATITNEGGNDLSSNVLLRDLNDADKVWARFGDYTIAAGGNVTVSANVTVPKAVFASWSNGGSPPVFVYTQDARGDATMFAVPLSRTAAPPGS